MWARRSARRSALKRGSRPKSGHGRGHGSAPRPRLLEASCRSPPASHDGAGQDRWQAAPPWRRAALTPPAAPSHHRRVITPSRKARPAVDPRLRSHGALRPRGAPPACGARGRPRVQGCGAGRRPRRGPALASSPSSPISPSPRRSRRPFAAIPARWLRPESLTTCTPPSRAPPRSSSAEAPPGGRS